MPKRKKRHDRSGRSYNKRKSNERELRKLFLIVCEGKETEYHYLKAFHTNSTIIKAESAEGGAHKVLAKARTCNSQSNVKLNKPFDERWCVFDKDDIPPELFQQLIQEAENLGFQVAYSNQCFELWYLLHFERFTHPVQSRDDYYQRLGRFIGKDYKKNSREMYDLLLSKQADAIDRATQLLEQHQSTRPGYAEPSTTVHLLIDSLNQQRRKAS